MNRLLLIIVAAAAVAAIALSLAYAGIQKNDSKTGYDDSTTFEQEEGDSEGDAPPFFETTLHIDVCPDATGSVKNPGVITRGGSELAIPLCIISTNTSDQVWHLEARGLIHEDIDSGIHVRFDKDSIRLAGVNDNSDFSMYHETKDNATVIVGADDKAEPGVHGIMIVATLQVGENRVTSVTTQVYVDVKES